jgi:hypothetical protein
MTAPPMASLAMPKQSIPFTNTSHKAAHNLIYDPTLDLSSVERRKSILKQPENISG